MRKRYFHGGGHKRDSCNVPLELVLCKKKKRWSCVFCIFFFFFLVPLYLKKTAFSLFFLVEQPLSESHIAVIRRYVWIICVMFVCACALPLFPHMPLRCYSHSFFVSSRSRFFLSFPLLLSLLLLLKLLLTFSVLRVSISSFLFFFSFRAMPRHVFLAVLHNLRYSSTSVDVYSRTIRHCLLSLPLTCCFLPRNVFSLLLFFFFLC